MHKLYLPALLSLLVGLSPLAGSEALLEKHCSTCHNDEKSKGKFNLRFLGNEPDHQSLEHWITVLDLVEAEEMPPEEDSELSKSDRETLVAFVNQKIHGYQSASQLTKKSKPRRMNNREFANSLRDVLLLEDIGAYGITGDLVGDTLHHGFDTHGETLGFSPFHLEKYMAAIRKVVDLTILSGPKPEVKQYTIKPERIQKEQRAQSSKRAAIFGNKEFYDFTDPLSSAIFSDFTSAPHSGRYKIAIQCTGKGRLTFPTKYTGLYPDDPIQVSLHLGDWVKTFDLPDDKIFEIVEDCWLPAGTPLELRNPTDGLRQYGNGNFKFQYRMTPDYYEKEDPVRYQKMLKEIAGKIPAKKLGRKKPGNHWSHWVDVWDGPRPRIVGATIEGPHFESWPPETNIALLGESPDVTNAEAILRPVAERAWRRPVKDDEMKELVDLVKLSAESMPQVEALKEGVISVLMSPSFLFLNTEEMDETGRLGSKLSYFLTSAPPSPQLNEFLANGKLKSFEGAREYLGSAVKEGRADAFLEHFPYAWMELADINFMAPDPDNFRFYHRKSVSDDMVNEVLNFFRHALENNIPLPEFLSANYSFINADLAEVYGIENGPKDSRFQKYTFTDGRRGGLLGMGAFLTVTADTLSTSPIHRAIFVMENFMGIHPTPPPPDVEIKEPDVRQAKTIKEILSAHTSDKTCATCHEAIDPWGYAFESFDSMGAWRDVYSVPDATTGDESLDDQKRSKKLMSTVPIDASARFRNGTAYEDIVGYRTQLLTPANRDRFVRCFISKLLLYANGESPADSDFVEVDKILNISAQNNYRVVDTIAAVVASPLFRD
ncbi:MAG: DUF1588 domain-containing protein [Verrucomicrobiales bacterium]|nr:DUF1588 domain-containing protein [Verrucomicrobiales bacterium]